jgi:hypothetical protein
MNTGIRADFAQPPRLFSDDPKSDAGTPDSPLEQEDQGVSGPEVSEVEAPPAPKPKPRNSRRTVAACVSIRATALSKKGLSS